jgi:uncharacterized coiled-coil DUF342 family protein
MVSLRDYVDTRVASVIETMSATERSMEIRLEAMNELRDQINRERGTFITRSEHDTTHKSLDQEIQGLREFRSEVNSKASITSVYFTATCVLVSLVISVASLIKSFY